MLSQEIRDIGRVLKIFGIIGYLCAWGSACYMALLQGAFGHRGQDWKNYIGEAWTSVALFSVPLLAFGLLLSLWRVRSERANLNKSQNKHRGRSVHFSTVYWITVVVFLFLLLNRVVTDTALRLDSGGPNFGALKSIALFLPLQLFPALMVRGAISTSENRKGEEWSMAWFFSCVCPVVLCLSLWGMGGLSASKEDHISAAEAHGGSYPDCIILSLASIILVASTWFLREKLKKSVTATVRIGFVLFLLVVLTGVATGFVKHPRGRMSYSKDYLGKFVYYDPSRETGESAAAEYYAGKRGASDESRGFGDEDFEYLLTLNGLGILSLVTCFGLLVHSTFGSMKKASKT